jgi:hypothetical protein
MAYDYGAWWHHPGSVTKNILAPISRGESCDATSISGVVRNFLQHYRLDGKDTAGQARFVESLSGIAA